jgi:hypothetical protein
MKQETKCYCGHTTYCDCGQETLEEASWKYNPLKKLDGEFIRHAFKEGAKWQQKQDTTDQAYDYFVAQCQEIGAGRGYEKTIHPHQIAKQQLRIPFPDYNYDALVWPRPKRTLYQ